MTRLAKVMCINNHYDKAIKGTRYKGAEFVLARDSAMRRVRAKLVDILEEWDDEVAPEPIEALTFEPIEALTFTVVEEDTAEKEVTEPDEVVEDEPVEKDPAAALLTQRGNSTWYDIEGHDKNPEQGKKKAMKIAQGIIDG